MAGRPLVAILCMETALARSLADYLERHGWAVTIGEEAWDAERILAEHRVDVAIVGSGPRSDDGLDLVRQLAATSEASLILLAPGQDSLTRILALELGAADVVDVDIPLRELSARIRGILARKGHMPSELLVLERATVDLKAALVMHRSGDEELLSPGQIALLRLFMDRPNVVLSRDDIIASAPAETLEAFDRSIDSRIVRLRRKLDTESIVTVRGAGYRFDPPAATATPHEGSPHPEDIKEDGSTDQRVD
jgi:two-component system, OmpR family, response regulator